MRDRKTRGVGADHDERRREIVDALLAIVSEHGLESVSVRDVAKQANVSVGRVQHYFGTKDEMLRAAFERINELGAQFVATRIAKAGNESPRTVLRAIATELLPIDEQHREASQIGLAFTARAVVEPEFAIQLCAGYDGLHQLFVLLLTRGREAGQTAADLDPAYEARLLLGLFDGLSTHALVGHLTVPSVLGLIDAHLDRLFTPAAPAAD